MDIIARMPARSLIVSLTMGLGLLNLAVGGQAQQRQRLNNVINLLEQKKPVFGVYAPTNATGRVRVGTAAPASAAVKSPMELAKEALAYHAADFLFSGSMESGVDRALPAFTDFVKAMNDAGALEKQPFPRLPAPLVIKTPKIGDSATNAVNNIGRQLNLGVSGIMFVEVESADEVRTGLAAMRFTSKGGTRADAVGTAPAYWGMSEQAYKQKADLWPLNPDGELINWAIVESKQGLAHVREIAAVKGIGVLWPGAGTLRGVFSSTNAAGERVFDAAGWEQAIQQVLAACQEFKVPCGFPATANDIELRLKQGFTVFVMGWGDAGFKAVEVGRAAAGRPPTQ